MHHRRRSAREGCEALVKVGVGPWRSSVATRWMMERRHVATCERLRRRSRRTMHPCAPSWKGYREHGMRKGGIRACRMTVRGARAALARLASLSVSTLLGRTSSTGKKMVCWESVPAPRAGESQDSRLGGFGREARGRRLDTAPAKANHDMKKVSCSHQPLMWCMRPCRHPWARVTSGGAQACLCHCLLLQSVPCGLGFVALLCAVRGPVVLAFLRGYAGNRASGGAAHAARGRCIARAVCAVRNPWPLRGVAGSVYMFTSFTRSLIVCRLSFL